MDQAQRLLAVLRQVDAFSDIRRVTDAMLPTTALAAD
jgi:hypothetical protein